MRRLVVALAAFGVVAMACGKGGGTEASPSESQPAPTSSSTVSPSPSAPQTAADCAQRADLKSPGTLTIGTDNPAFQPWFGGEKGAGEGPWKADPNNGTGNPYTGEGFEGSVAYAVADQMGFPKDQVTWVAVPFNNSYKPGDKDFDFYIGQVSYRTERANAVDFSESYYNVQQALVADKDSAIAHATTFADLSDANLGAQIGTTSYQYIVDNIQPSKQPSVYDNSNDVIAALNAGQIDGYLVDAPTAYVNVLIGETTNGTVVGQFPTLGDQEYFGLVLGKDSSLTPCTDLAIEALRADGTLDSLQQQWLKDITYPEITPS
ncbi:MAG TPA: ABC transporter substrate-binding protein [Actinomycetota bacterium]